MKSLSRDRLLVEDPVPDCTTPSQEAPDPLVMEKYTERLHTEVRARAWRHPPLHSHPTMISAYPAAMGAELPL